MIRVSIKPLSLNNAYIGRRFVSPTLKAYKLAVFYQLPPLTIPQGKLRVKYIFGVSRSTIDGDNLVKCLQDVLAEKYGFNDRDIYRWEVEKVLVPKGQEYAAFEIGALTL